MFNFAHSLSLSNLSLSLHEAIFDGQRSVRNKTKREKEGGNEGFSDYSGL